MTLKGNPNPFLSACYYVISWKWSFVPRSSRRSSRSPLPGDEVDVMSESRVIFRQLLGRRVLSGILRFGRIGVHHGAEIQENAQEQGEDRGPRLHYHTHLFERNTESVIRNPDESLSHC